MQTRTLIPAARAYARLAACYDWIFGATLDLGRREAVRRLPLSSGDTVLDVGVGTGLTASLYPTDCVVTGIDISKPMLERAERRLAALGANHVTLMHMDASDLQFEDESFAVTYAAYTVSAVADPVKVVNEMCRVCRTGGYVVLLNHFQSNGPVASKIERLLSPVTAPLGFLADLGLPQLLANAQLAIDSIYKVNVPPLWSLVICRKIPGDAPNAAPHECAM